MDETRKEDPAHHLLQNMIEGTIIVDDQGKVLMMNQAAEEIYGLSLAEAAGFPIASTAIVGEEKIAKALRASSAVVQNEAGEIVGIISPPADIAKLKEIERLKEDFISHVTHELRAPLSSIRAALEILEGNVAKNIKPEDARLIKIAIQNSDHLSELINSILDFSKIESGQMTAHPRKISSREIAQKAVDSLSAWAQKKGVSLSLSLSPDPPPLWADPQRSIQILINLLSNAIKFTPKGGEISVRVEPSKEKPAALFAVSDTGCGIPPEDQKRVFEKFAQAGSKEYPPQGTGLGLPIAKALVQLQGGELWLKSSVGQGSTFFFTLPLYSQTDEDSIQELENKKVPFWKKLFYRITPRAPAHKRKR